MTRYSLRSRTDHLMKITRVTPISREQYVREVGPFIPPLEAGEIWDRNGGKWIVARSDGSTVYRWGCDLVNRHTCEHLGRDAVSVEDLCHAEAFEDNPLDTMRAFSYLHEPHHVGLHWAPGAAASEAAEVAA